MQGRGVTRNDKEAVLLFKLAAICGNTGGQTELGRCYEWGLGVEKDLSKAARLFRLAMDDKNWDSYA